MSVERNIDEVKKNIERAKQRSRYDQEVELIAVTKTVDDERMMQAYRSGILDFGENKVQEIQKKYESFPKEVRWHLIGTLQTNKVKYIIDKVHMIHSLDRDSLAKEIDKRAGERSKVMDCLVQVNISQEDSKHGQTKEETLDFVAHVCNSYPHIRIRGLMGMAPFEEDNERTRRYFADMKKLFEEAKTLNLGKSEMKYLSVGMTNDYEIAIEEGSTIVRVGTGIFGERNY
ncbi:MAG: YggS family pyridoxal phosphate-dependent enzyme [Filifactor alocis]|nr:YggS family pyridoxal phosphate-dependent enzyme [Filifactor alocis]